MTMSSSSFLKQLIPDMLADAAFLHPERGLRRVSEQFKGSAVFSTSFSNEDQVITHLIHSYAPDLHLFTLDTGRLFPETYAVWSRTVEKYGINIKAHYPDQHHVSDHVTRHGPNAFYTSVDLRKECCHIRKVAPLGQALKGRSIWITGLRSGHSADRSQLKSIEWDSHHEVIKYHPLLHWTAKEVTDYLKEHEVPVNILHDRGFPSIGCAPCTRAIEPGEDFRAGRWWWEKNSGKECGLHSTVDKNTETT